MRLYCLFISLLTIIGCLGKPCTDSPCPDMLHLTLGTDDDNTWKAGQYKFEIAFDEQSCECVVTIPDDLPETDSGMENVTCGPESCARFVAETDCAEESSEHEICSPIPDHWLLKVITSGTPDALSVRVTYNSTLIFEHREEPEYQKYWPNGRHCPFCEESENTLKLN